MNNTPSILPSQALRLIYQKKYTEAALHLRATYKNTGNVYAYHRLGELYLENKITAKNNINVAIHIFNHCAIKGFLASQTVLANIYSCKKYGRFNLLLSRYWFQIAAKNPP